MITFQETSIYPYRTQICIHGTVTVAYNVAMIFEEQLLTETLYIRGASTSHVNKDSHLAAVCV